MFGVWHCGKTRARQTAEIIHSSISSICKLLQRDGLSPTDPVEEIKHAVEAGGVDVMIVGHLPFLNKLAALLLTGDENADAVTFQNGGILCLKLQEADHWSIARMIVPEILEK